MKDTQLLDSTNQATVIAGLRALQLFIENHGLDSTTKQFPCFADAGIECPSILEINDLIEDLNVEHHFTSPEQPPLLEEGKQTINVLVLVDFHHDKIPDSVFEAQFDGKNYYRSGEALNCKHRTVKGWQYLPSAPSAQNF
ncbi:TPA: hypothetical protein ACGSTL_001209 [Vibrio parahaemolyticus]|uniref:hypothetical protein n=1 Tax=Vibrio campbellii TaxID=680 RepID=UPI001F075267|nr:hypothetical protein [Vibrio campbellii]UMM06628.1 hypothetical protein MKR81_27155 [Vibrio campbellii]